MEDLCTNKCKSAKSALLFQDTKMGHPTVYVQIRQKLEEAQVAPQLLDMTIAAEMLDHIQAGHEGTGITLIFRMCELARNPSSTAKLQEELVTLGTNPTAQLIDGLLFLDAVLMETMRLYPGSFGPFPRYVPEKGASLANCAIPAGTTVSASVYSLHIDPGVFPEPEEWCPERWMEATTENRREMMKWFWVFGSGGRMCIGNHLATRSKSFLRLKLFMMLIP
jgi:cytochrome P450